ncbi:hypothetical protein N7474_001969 [Penicillium riverlandense]|uniref:uncharacterized protein n=1 Tax=Penicillium riverlandense TaxID=1903569 RepID=UPI002549073A|nr:uncharacterized protein N7474_001969 [Penicillium riverlandense]KAJ5833658.1 hypothetical protein N7474_001969 [Penicillium riverlandense]
MSSGTVQGQSRRRDRYIRIACHSHGVHGLISSLETQVRSIQKRLDGDPFGYLNHVQRDPMFLLNAEGTTRLIDLYHKEICHMYPVVEKELLVSKAKSLRSIRRPASAHSGNAEGPPTKNGGDIDSTILYAVLAHALYLGDQQNPVVSALLFERVEQSIGEMLSQAEAQLKIIVVLVISSLYYLHKRQDLRAWRMIRFAVEQALELQLHTQEGLARYGQLSNRTWALRVFWSVYVLDLRYSFGNNLPATLEDTDINSSIPEPGLEYPYLNAMVTYSRIASKIKRWTCKPRFQRGKSLPTENGFLDFQIVMWYSQLPPQIQFEMPTSDNTHEVLTGLFPLQLRVSLYLRRNQMRMLLHKPSLQSVSAVQQNTEQAKTAVRLATETIETLVYIGKFSSTFNAQPAVLSYFLISALAVFFPAAVNGPSDIISLCWSEVIKAMELIRAFSKTYACAHLQRFLQDVRDFVNHSGRSPLPSRSPQDARPSSGAGTDSVRSDTRDDTINPTSLAEELYTLFEAAISCGTRQVALREDLGHQQTEPNTRLDTPNMTSMVGDIGVDLGGDIERAILDYYGYDGFPGMFDGME